MNTFPEGSTVEYLESIGIDIKKALLVMICNHHDVFPTGTLLRLTKDDHSDAPYFKAPNGRVAAVFLHRLATVDCNALDPSLRLAVVKAKLKGF
jgi:hypothetical protein